VNKSDFKIPASVTFAESALASHHENHNQTVKTEPYVKYLLLGIWVTMTVAYYFAFFYLADLEGSLFVNAVILGSAEVFANFASGFLMLYVREDVAYRACSLIALVFNFAIPYVSNPYLSFVFLFLAIGGLGGMDNSIYLLIEMQVSPTDVGGVMQLLCVSAAVASSTVSVLATLPQPIPIYLTALLCIASLVLTTFLPEGGRFLPKDDCERDYLVENVISNIQSPRVSKKIFEKSNLEVAYQ
jgi:hypothetical protein